MTARFFAVATAIALLLGASLTAATYASSQRPALASEKAVVHGLELLHQTVIYSDDDD